MAEIPRSGSPRKVRLAQEAEADLSAIYDYSAQLWGEDQADTYHEFLVTVMQELARSPEIAPLALRLGDVKIYTARWKNAQHGHRIFYTENDEGIVVARILHTAMNWTDYFGG